MPESQWHHGPWIDIPWSWLFPDEPEPPDWNKSPATLVVTGYDPTTNSIGLMRQDEQQENRKGTDAT